MRWTTRVCIIWLLWNTPRPKRKLRMLSWSSLSVGEDDEGEYLDVVDDDELLLELGKLFEERLSDEYDIEE